MYKKYCITKIFPHTFHYKLKAVLYTGSWHINVSYDVMEKLKKLNKDNL